MPVKIQSIKSAVADNGLKLLIYGPAGAGKTVLSATAGMSTIILSAEAGLLSIRDAPSYVKTAQISTIEDLEDMYDYLLEKADDPDFHWVNLDSISEIAEVILDEEKLDTKDPRKAYGEMQTRMMRILRQFRDLPKYNVVMTCKQFRLIDEATGKHIYYPMLPGKNLPQQIGYMFDEVFALRVENEKDGSIYRVLQTSRDSQFEAKDRSGMLDLFEPPNLRKIFEKIYPNSPLLKKKPGKKKTEPVPEPEKESKAEEENDIVIE